MRKMKTKSNYTKYVFIALGIVFLIAAALMFLSVWESVHGKYPVSDTNSGIINYEGKEYVLKDNIETFLVLGLDKYEGATFSDSHESGSVQADFLMLLVFDNEMQSYTAVHINRDTMANVNRLGIGGSKIDTVKKQIALAYNYVYGDSEKISCRNTADAVADILDIDVDHYMSLTMDSVVAINDFVGGVEVTVLDDFTGIDDTLVKDELVTLAGEQALRYVRTRYGLEDSSNSTRMHRQQQYIDALYDKTVSCIEADDEFIIKLIDEMDEYVVYDSSDSKMQKFAEKIRQYEFLGIREIEGESKLGEEFIEFYPREDSVQKMVIDLFYEPKD